MKRSADSCNASPAWPYSAHVREHLLPIFTGIGANGKSTLYNALLHTLNDYGHAAEPTCLCTTTAPTPPARWTCSGGGWSSSANPTKAGTSPRPP